MSADIPWAALLDTTDKGTIRSNLANAVEVFHHATEYGPGRLWYDEFLDRTMLLNSPPRECGDADETAATVYMQNVVGMTSISELHVASAMRYVARQRPRHCVREFVSAIPWDDEPRIETALEHYWGAMPTTQQPLEYLRAVSRNFFVGLIARIMQPGCQLDHMVVLEGAQGIGKAKSLRVLGGAYYMLATESVASKDFQQALPGRWIVEIGELESFSRAERERVKLIITCPIDRYRASYGRRAEDHPRQCVFVGTTNRDDWGNDETGLRRFLPIRCGCIDDASLAADRAQLFAEALSRYQAGATWWDVPPETVTIQRDRQHEDVWTTTVLDWCMGKADVTTLEVLIGALHFDEADVTRIEQNRVGAILRFDGRVRKPVRRSGRLVKAYVVDDGNGNENGNS